MKILAEYTRQNTIAGFQKAAESIGIEWIWWNSNIEPAFDAFDLVKPGMFFSMSMSRSVLKNIKELNIPYVIVNLNNYFSFVIKKNNESLEHIMNFNAIVDNNMFFNRRKMKEYDCDIAIVLEKEPGNLTTSLCEEIGKYNIKVIGEKNYGFPQYMGACDANEKAMLYSSSKLVLVQSLFEATRVIACGGKPITDPPCLTYDNGEKIFGYTIDEIEPLMYNNDTSTNSLKEYNTYGDVLSKILNEVGIYE